MSESIRLYHKFSKVQNPDYEISVLCFKGYCACLITCNFTVRMCILKFFVTFFSETAKIRNIAYLFIWQNFRQINSQNHHHTNYPCHHGTSVFLNRTCLIFVRFYESHFFVCQQAYYHSQSTLPISNIIERAHQLLASIPSDIHPEKLLSSLIQTDTQNKNKENTCLSFQPLTSPYYPIITRYPKFIVNYHIQERERIREEEKEYLRQKYVSLYLEAVYFIWFFILKCCIFCPLFFVSSLLCFSHSLWLLFVPVHFALWTIS